MDQFRQLRPGEPLPGLYTRPWNKFLENLATTETPPIPGDRSVTPVEIWIKNTTVSNVDAFSILAVTGTLNTFAADPNGFKLADIFTGATPAASTPTIAIVQDGIPGGAIGRAIAIGRTACRVNITDTAHRYAVPSTSVGRLESATSGPVRILASENNFAVGEQWAVVLLLGQAAGGGTGSRFVLFALVSALAATSASQAACPVNDFWGGPDPGATVTVWNMPASSNFVFAGSAGAKGYATFDEIDGKWRIIQLECTAGAGGGGAGGTGLTGTIGD